MFVDCSILWSVSCLTVCQLVIACKKLRFWIQTAQVSYHHPVMLKKILLCILPSLLLLSGWFTVFQAHRFPSYSNARQLSSNLWTAAPLSTLLPLHRMSLFPHVTPSSHLRLVSSYFYTCTLRHQNMLFPFPYTLMMLSVTLQHFMKM